MASHRYRAAAAAVVGLLVVVGVAVPRAGARQLDLAVRDAAHPDIAAPAYFGEVLSLKLRAPAAGGLARSDGRVRRLGIRAVDATASALGAWFEPEFKGERPGAPGAEDLAAFYLVHLPEGTSLGEALDRFAGLAEVERADPIPVMPVTAVPDDSLWSRSSWFYQPPSRHDLHAPEAWDMTTGDSSIVVAIVDTGLLPYHPDIGGREAGLAGNVWTNWAERGGVAGVDDDGNGFVDDEWGWDFVDLIPGTDVRPGEDGYDPDNDPNDFVGHGTNVAGLIGAIANNRSGVAGTAWNVRLMALRVGWASVHAPTGEVSLSYAAQAIRYATRMGARVINCSFSTQPYGPLEAAASDASREGVLVVVAAGNNGSGNALGAREDALSVASVDANDQVSRFSNRAPSVDLAAPGEGLATTAITRLGSDSLGVRQPAYAIGANGTSFAAAIASGAVALVQARRKTLHLPALSPQEMILHLRETSDDIAASNPGVTGYGVGRLNLARAVAEEPASHVIRAGATTVGSAVVLPGDGGAARVAYVTSDARLVFLDGATGEVLAAAALPGTPASGLAAADLGGGFGDGLFVGLTNGIVAGFSTSGVPLPGWPVHARTPGVSFSGGTALGDLDGDGILEIVSVSPSEGVLAWHADGTPLSGFPQFGFDGVTAPVAITNLDGRPGAEIIVATAAGEVHTIGSDGREVTGWPVRIGTVVPAAAPVVARFGAESTTTVLIADGSDLLAIRPDGSLRFRTQLWNYAVKDLALADIDGDGSDEIVIASGANLAVFDSTGVMLPGWPVVWSTLPSGPPVVGPVAPGGGTGIVIRGGEGLIAFDAEARPLPGYPKPGFAGEAPTLAQLDGDAATELVAGTGPDSLIYMYDLGAASWHESPQQWLTVRGNFARTGSRVYAPGLAPVDGVAPNPIADLASTGVTSSEASLRWTAPADLPSGGPVARYELRQSDLVPDGGNFVTSVHEGGTPGPSTPGTPERMTVTGLAEGRAYFFAMRSRDRYGNASLPSNVIEVRTARIAPGAVRDLVVESAGDTLATLRWTATGDDSSSGKPLRYLLHAAPAPIDEAGFDSAPFASVVEASTAANGTERRTMTGLPRGKRLWFALRAEDHAGTLSPLSNIVSARLAIGGPLAGRDGLALASGRQPAHAPIAMWWQAGPAGEGALHRIDFYDVGGRRVRTITVGTGVGGVTAWDGRDEQGVGLSPGLYFARLSSGEGRADARIVLLP